MDNVEEVVAKARVEMEAQRVARMRFEEVTDDFQRIARKLNLVTNAFALVLIVFSTVYVLKEWLHVF